MAFTTINKSTDYFNTKLYTGNGSTQSISGIGFQPDWLWVKCRSDANGSQLFDVLRTTYSLSSNATDAEANRASDGFTSLDSDGFTMNGSGSGGSTNVNGRTYAAWNWKAGGTGSANTSGSINSTVSVNTTAGFSIVSFTGTAANATVGHGLGVAPKVIITKSRVNAENWGFYHEALGNTKQVTLNTTGVATGASSAYYNNTSPTSTVFSIGTADSTNDNQNMIAYCFAEKTGYSKFGSYRGNGSSDGAFVYTGFRPAFVIIKGAVSGDGNAGQHWELFDNKRLGYNVDNNSLLPSSSGTENTGDRIDLLSNGFKIRISSDGVNDNNSTYIYMAFGQSLVGTNNIPCTAR